MAIIKVLLSLFAVTTIAFELYKNWNNLGFIIKIWKRFRLLMLFECIGLILFMIAGYLLLDLYVPVLSWGWSNLVYSGGGNIIFSPILDSTKNDQTLYLVIGTIFLVALLFGLPFIVHAEEVTFRSHHTEWSKVIKQSLKFGFIHLFVGVPISVGLLLSVVGLFFARKYIKTYQEAMGQGLRPSDSDKEALLNSTAYHTMYNSICILTFIAVIWTH